MDKTEIDYIFSLIEPILYGELDARNELQKKGINICSIKISGSLNTSSANL